MKINLKKIEIKLKDNCEEIKDLEIKYNNLINKKKMYSKKNHININNNNLKKNYINKNNNNLKKNQKLKEDNNDWNFILKSNKSSKEKWCKNKLKNNLNFTPNINKKSKNWNRKLTDIYQIDKKKNKKLNLNEIKVIKENYENKIDKPKQKIFKNYKKYVDWNNNNKLKINLKVWEKIN